MTRSDHDYNVNTMNSDQVQLTVVMPRETRERLRTVTAKTGVNTANLLRLAINQFLDRAENAN